MGLETASSSQEEGRGSGAGGEALWCLFKLEYW
jgi:hypothetical protein